MCQNGHILLLTGNRDRKIGPVFFPRQHTYSCIYGPVLSISVFPFIRKFLYMLCCFSHELPKVVCPINVIQCFLLPFCFSFAIGLCTIHHHMPTRLISSMLCCLSSAVAMVIFMSFHLYLSNLICFEWERFLEDVSITRSFETTLFTKREETCNFPLLKSFTFLHLLFYFILKGLDNPAAKN